MPKGLAKPFNLPQHQNSANYKNNDKTSPKIAILDYKIDTGSKHNSMLLNIFITLFPKTQIAELNKYINKKLYCVHTIIPAYHNMVCAK